MKFENELIELQISVPVNFLETEKLTFIILQTK